MLLKSNRACNYPAAFKVAKEVLAFSSELACLRTRKVICNQSDFTAFNKLVHLRFGKLHDRFSLNEKKETRWNQRQAKKGYEFEDSLDCSIRYNTTVWNQRNLTASLDRANDSPVFLPWRVITRLHTFKLLEHPHRCVGKLCKRELLAQADRGPPKKGRYPHLGEISTFTGMFCENIDGSRKEWTEGRS